MVQTVRLEACGASYQTKRTQNIFMLSYPLTYSILLSTTSQRLAVRPFSPERETCCMLPICRAFAFLPFIILTFHKRTFCFTPAIPTGFHSSEPKAHLSYTLSSASVIPAGIIHSVFVPRLPVMVSLFHTPLAE